MGRGPGSQEGMVSCPRRAASTGPGFHSRSVSSWTWALTRCTVACRSFQLRMAPASARRSSARPSK